MTQQIDVELAMRRCGTLADMLKHKARGTRVEMTPERCAQCAEDLELVLETLHQRGFAYDR